MSIIFENDAPNEPLFAKSVSLKPTLDGVEVTVNVLVAEPPGSTVPVQILLEPQVAAELGPQFETVAGIVERWRLNQP